MKNNFLNLNDGSYLLKSPKKEEKSLNLWNPRYPESSVSGSLGFRIAESPELWVSEAEVSGALIFRNPGIPRGRPGTQEWTES